MLRCSRFCLTHGRHREQAPCTALHCSCAQATSVAKALASAAVSILLIPCTVSYPADTQVSLSS